MTHILYKLFEHKYLSKEEAKDMLRGITSGEYTDAQIASLITVFLMRSITIDELCGFREALLEMCIKVDLDTDKAIDIVGTGGDGKNTFNISTASCFLVAGAGYQVIKHGNYGSSSISGASNVLEHYGVKFSNDISKLSRSLEQSKITYLHAQLFNPAMKAVASVRKALAVRTFFNMLGPLVNPAMPKYQLLGVYNLPLLRLYNYTYQSTDINYTIIHSLDGYDEISLTSQFKVATVDSEKIYTPESLGFECYKENDLFGGESVADAAVIFNNILSNKATEAQQNVVIINAAFAIQTLCSDKSIEECISISRESLESGKALQSFKKFVELNS